MTKNYDPATIHHLLTLTIHALTAEQRAEVYAYTWRLNKLGGMRRARLNGDLTELVGIMAWKGRCYRDVFGDGSRGIVAEDVEPERDECDPAVLACWDALEEQGCDTDKALEQAAEIVAEAYADDDGRDY